MASHQLIDTYLAELRRRLPADAVDELADGLTETWHHHLATGLSDQNAARAAIAQFGTTAQITTAFVTNAPGRRTAQILLATGPAAGICWGTSLIAAQVWTWPLPSGAAILFAVVVLAVVAALGAAASSRRSYRRTRLGGVGGLGLLVLDAAMLAGVVMLAPALVWPMAVAVPVSIARIGLTLRALPSALAR
jgi:hypothetical protein